MNNKGILVAAATALALFAAPVAHAGNFGVGADVALPSGAFNDLYNSGFGLHALLKYPVTPLAQITGDVGWTSFGLGNLSDLQENPFGGDVDVWNVTGGAKVNLLPLGLGLEYGYFSKIEEWSLVPYASFGFSKLDLALRYKATDYNWWEVRVGVFF